jgi:hypothetical protein
MRPQLVYCSFVAVPLICASCAKTERQYNENTDAGAGNHSVSLGGSQPAGSGGTLAQQSASRGGSSASSIQSVNSGGTTTQGTTTVTGGSIGVGGTTHKVGTTSIGGTSETGGTSAAGGTLAVGGTVSKGGSSAKGGSSGTTCNNGNCVGRTNGESCSTASDCASNVCADGVCCDVGCDGQCESCNLSGSKGVCSPSSTPKANNPCTTDGSVCGGVCDGTSAHRKACVYPSNTTLCGPGASCNTSTNQSTSSQLCSGSGQCKSPVVKSCAPYTCNGTVCGSGCPTDQGVCGGACVDIMSDAAHCGGACQKCSNINPRCYSGACVQCTVGSDCNVLGYGPGSICTSNHTCQCRQPSTANKIRNPGFDSSLQYWTPSPCTGCASQPVAFDSNYDVDGCAESGAALLTYFSLASGSISQCVAVQPNTYYNLGFVFRQEGSSTNAIICTVEDYVGSTCSGNTVSTIPSLGSGDAPAAGTWSSASTSFTTASSVGSVLINCGHFNYSKAWMDHIYLNPSGSFF